MNWRSGLFLFLLFVMPAPLQADAIVITQAMSASTIAEIFVNDQSIRVELEIGAEDLVPFSNLLPDGIYEKLDLQPRPQDERIRKFFTDTFVICDEQENVLNGRVTRLEARQRIKRDEITGQPLAVQPRDAEFVVYADLTFDLLGRPQSISIQPPIGAADGRSTANIGFVTYHQRLPVSDFRYLAARETLDLDWQDPWYSRFRNKNLRRQYGSPVNVFLYVEPFEVRKEIVIRPVDLQRWMDLDIDTRGTIAIADQAELKQRVAEFLADKHPVEIDGQPVRGQLDRIHFIRRTLRETGVVYPDEDLPATSATLGAIIVYPIETLPQQVTMKWEWFDEKIQQVPATATDEAGGLPSTLTPDDPVLVWKNYLTNPTIPAMRAVPIPRQVTRIGLPVVSLACGLFVVLIAARAMGDSTKRLPMLGAIVFLIVMGVLAWPWMRLSIANPWVGTNSVNAAQADEIIKSLLHNVYHAFDRRQEDLVYDQLETSLSGQILRDIYLQTRQRIQLADQGGAQVKIDNVEIESNQVKSSDPNGFTCRCNWVATGTVGHWGHLHRRALGYAADFRIQPIDDAWKITSMQVVNETQPELQ